MTVVERAHAAGAALRAATDSAVDAVALLERLERETATRRRQRWTVGIAAVAAAAVAAGVFVATAGENSTAPDPTDVIPSPAPEIALTADVLQGIWAEDPGTGYWAQGILVKFGADGEFAMGGVLGYDSWITGTYEVAPPAIVFTATGGDCGGGDSFRWTTTSVREGRFESVHANGAEGQGSDGTVGGCPIENGEPYDFTRVSPFSDASVGTEFEPSLRLRNVGTLSSDSDPSLLNGYWLVEGTGQVVRIQGNGAYFMDGEGRLGPVTSQDTGDIVFGPSSMTFTSGSNSSCGPGGAMVWEDVAVDEDGMRATVTEDSCGRGFDDSVVVRLLDVNLP